MTEIGWLVLVVIAAALVLIALAGWMLASTIVRILNYVEMWLLDDGARICLPADPEKSKPPDMRHPQAHAEGQFEAPMVRRARARMEARMRRDADGA